MRGVDLLDQFIANYHLRIKSKEMLVAFFAWSLNTVVGN